MPEGYAIYERGDATWMRYAEMHDLKLVHDPCRLAWRGRIAYSGGQMYIEIEDAPDKPFCGTKNYECYWECRLWPHHDGPHMPFTKELLHTQPDLVVTAMRSA